MSDILFNSAEHTQKVDAILMQQRTESLELLAPIEQIDAHFEHQKRSTGPRAAQF